MVETVDLIDLVTERAAHDEPHDELDPLGACLDHVLEVRLVLQYLGLVDEVVHELDVPRQVDQTRPGSLDLVTHAAGSPDLHVEIFVIAHSNEEEYRSFLGDKKKEPYWDRFHRIYVKYPVEANQAALVTHKMWNSSNYANPVDQGGVHVEPILFDYEQLVGEGLEFTRAAEVLVIDPKNWAIAFRGPAGSASVTTMRTSVGRR